MWSVFSWEASRDCAFGHAHSPSERESRSVHRGHAHCSPPGFLSWDSPGENTGLGCHSLLQRVFPTQRPRWREYWTGSPFPSPGVFPTQRPKSRVPPLQAGSLATVETLLEGKKFPEPKSREWPPQMPPRVAARSSVGWPARQRPLQLTVDRLLDSCGF